MDWIIWMMAIIGHIGIWCVVFNQVHATAWPRPTRKSSEKFILFAVAAPLLVVAIFAIARQTIGFEEILTVSLFYWYAMICVVLACFFVLQWVYRKY